MKSNIFTIICVIAGLLSISIFLTDCSNKNVKKYLDNGIAKYNEGDFNGALEQFSKAIEIDPEYADAYNNRGLVKDNIGDYY
ncbi:MAG TPA: tetratricopeptide repeat protein, partial [Bacteroidota bacterium]|nr:tetratricopeptide repeat protein [Bacteroidota bacterium]